ncbi:MAG: 50S ribosomal protein L11 methyltransferase [Blastocatellia bacterium]
MSENAKNESFNQMIENLKKRAEELGIETDPKKLEEEQKKKRLSFLENKIAFGIPQWEITGEPSLVGEKFVVGRSWHQDLVTTEPEYRGRTFIQIDPGVAFGSSHPTTSVCIEAIEKYWKGGNFLDIGTGTGILAIAAAILQPKAVIDAFDISLDITEHATLHIKINNIANINIRQGTIEDYYDKTYDLVMANLLPDLLSILKTKIISKIKPDGLLVISGFSEKAHGRTFASFDWVPTVSEGMDAANVAEMFTDLGMKLVEKRNIGEWVGLVLQNPERVK